MVADLLVTRPQVLASAKGGLLQADVRGNLTNSMKEVSSSGDHSLAVQMIHSVSETLNQQNIAGNEASVEMRTEMLNLMCEQATCIKVEPRL